MTVVRNDGDRSPQPQVETLSQINDQPAIAADRHGVHPVRLAGIPLLQVDLLGGRALDAFTHRDHPRQELPVEDGEVFVREDAVDDAAQVYGRLAAAAAHPRAHGLRCDVERRHACAAPAAAQQVLLAHNSPAL